MKGRFSGKGWPYVVMHEVGLPVEQHGDVWRHDRAWIQYIVEWAKQQPRSIGERIIRDIGAHPELGYSIAALYVGESGWEWLRHFVRLCRDQDTPTALRNTYKLVQVSEIMKQ